MKVSTVKSKLYDSGFCLAAFLAVLDLFGLAAAPVWSQSAEDLIRVNIDPISAAVLTRGARQFRAIVTGNANTNVTWFVNDVAGGNASFGTISATGLYSAPRAVPNPNVVRVKAVSNLAPTRQATAQVTVQPGIFVDVSPGAASVMTGATKQFNAAVTGLSDTRVEWAVNDRLGGTQTLGRIGPTGLYTAPATVPSPARLTITAVSRADRSRKGSAELTVMGALTVSISPAGASVRAAATRQFSAAVTGGPNQAVTWYVNGVAGGNATVGTIGAGGMYTAPAAPPRPAAVTVKAVSVADPTRSASTQLTVTFSASVTISPAAANLSPGTQKQFRAGVSGVTNQAVTWSVNGVAGGNAAVGRIDAHGLYTAPAHSPSPNIVTVSAASVVDPTIPANAQVTLRDPGTVTVSPAAATLHPGESRQFNAAVTGLNNSAVRWRVNNLEGGSQSLGRISSNGAYTAPQTRPALSTLTISATSVERPTLSGAAQVTLVDHVAIQISPNAATLRVRATQQFSAAVTGGVNRTVTWLVKNIQGGNATVGTISASGLYTAPAAVPSPNMVTIQARSVEEPDRLGSARLTVQP